MLMPPWYEKEPQSYKSYKAQKFEKYVQRQKALVQGVKDSSLKEEDKIKLLDQMLLQFPPF